MLKLQALHSSSRGQTEPGASSLLRLALACWPIRSLGAVTISLPAPVAKVPNCQTQGSWRLRSLGNKSHHGDHSPILALLASSLSTSLPCSTPSPQSTQVEQSAGWKGQASRSVHPLYAVPLSHRS